MINIYFYILTVFAFTLIFYTSCSFCHCMYIKTFLNQFFIGYCLLYFCACSRFVGYYYFLFHTLCLNGDERDRIYISLHCLNILLKVSHSIGYTLNKMGKNGQLDGIDFIMFHFTSLIICKSNQWNFIIYHLFHFITLIQTRP